MDYLNLIVIVAVVIAIAVATFGLFQAGKGVSDFFGGIGTGLSDAFGGLGDAIKSTQDAFGSTAEAIGATGEAFKATQDWASDIAGGIEGAVGGIGQALADASGASQEAIVSWALGMAGIGAGTQLEGGIVQPPSARKLLEMEKPASQPSLINPWGFTPTKDIIAWQRKGGYFPVLSEEQLLTMPSEEILFQIVPDDLTPSEVRRRYAEIRQQGKLMIM